MSAPAALKIGVDKGPRAGVELRLLPGHVVSIGRQAGCELVLDGDDFVAPRHAEINWREGVPILRNLSSNGTLVNGRPVQQHPLSAGDKIVIGLMHLVSVRAAAGGKDTSSVPGPARQTRPAARTATGTRQPADGNVPRSAPFKIPFWLKAYLVAMAVLFALFAVQKSRTPAAVGLPQIQDQERRFATANKLSDEETERVLRWVELGVVYERRGVPRSASESYREALSARQRVEPGSPAYRYAASRLAEIGRK